MTTEDAAHQAADREGFQLQDPIAYGFRRARRIAHQRDLYVRAFLAGAQWQHTQESPLNKITYEDTKTLARGPSAEVDSPTGSPRSPQRDSSQRKDTA